MLQRFAAQSKVAVFRHARQMVKPMVIPTATNMMMPKTPFYIPYRNFSKNTLGDFDNFKT